MPSARRIQWAKTRVGITAFVALLILGVFLALLTGGRLFRQYDELRVFMPDAAGVGPGSPVRLNGIPAGRIESVALSRSADPNRVVEVRIRVQHDLVRQIPQDSVATITAENVQGEMYLDITRGQGARPVKPGGEIPFQPAPDVMKRIDLAEFERRLRAVDEMLARIERGEGPVGKLMIGEAIYDQTLCRLDEVQSAVRRAVSSQQKLGRLLYTDVEYERIVKPVRELDERLAQLQQSGLLRDTGAYERIRAQLREVRGTLEKTRRHPWLRGDQAYLEWNRRVADMIRAVDEFNLSPMILSAQAYESMNGALREMAGAVRDFRTDPRKFLRMSIF
ncbi:MAG: MlaD family protein [Bryobacteraceae bacterium]